jgi:uncharacterized protein (DUF1778 family)
MPRTSVSKPSRLNIRVSQQEKDVLTRAARVVNTSVSSFVVQRAYAEAQAVLAEQSEFRLSDKQWREFSKALDAPPRDIPALRRLLSGRGVFDE